MEQEDNLNSMIEKHGHFDATGFEIGGMEFQGKRFGETGTGDLGSWCFEPSHPQKITSGLKKTSFYVQVIHFTKKSETELTASILKKKKKKKDPKHTRD